jgi:osmotically inducible protein OsmC
MKRKASARWQGGLKTGMGTVSTESGALKVEPYSFFFRFDNQPGTNPEELIAAAHAGCFAMALSGALGGAGMIAEILEVTATVSLETVDGKPTVTTSHLDLTARIPGADATKFKETAEGAKAACPISRLLNATITLDAKLVS